MADEADKGEQKGKGKRAKRKLVDSGQRLVLTRAEVPYEALDADTRERLERCAEWPDPTTVSEPIEVWVPLTSIEDDKEGAIHAVARDAEGKEVPGTYRAPTASSWRGGLTLVEPQQIPLERVRID